MHVVAFKIPDATGLKERLNVGENVGLYFFIRSSLQEAEIL